MDWKDPSITPYPEEDYFLAKWPDGYAAIVTKAELLQYPIEVYKGDRWKKAEGQPEAWTELLI